MKLMARFGRSANWLFTLIGASSLVVVFLSFSHKVVGQERRSYMIPGRVFSGMSGVQPGTVRFEGDVQKQWIADVDETEWQYLVIHHSATVSGSVELIHEQHLKRRDTDGNPWLGIGYHFVIGNGQGMADGAIQATFRWKEQIHGAHSGSAVVNARGIGICVIGNFENSSPSIAQLKSLKTLVRFLAVRHRITPENLMGHADVKATACPGKHFPLNDVRQVISAPF